MFRVTESDDEVDSLGLSCPRRLPRDGVPRDDRGGRHRKRSGRRGFTLVEVVLSMVIMSLVALLFLDAMVNATETMSLYETRRESAFMIDFALKRFLKDVRYMKRGGLAVAQSSQLEYLDSFGRKVVYQMNGTDLQLVINGSTPATLAENIQSINIRYFDKTNNEIASPVITLGDVHWLEVTVSGTPEILNYSNTIQIFPREMFR